jgi:ATP-dependent RNA helicase DeaD
MNSKIPFEVVNSVTEACGNELETPVVDAADVVAASDSPAPEESALKPSKVAKKLRARKIAALEVEAALLAVAQLPSIDLSPVSGEQVSSTPAKSTQSVVIDEKVALSMEPVSDSNRVIAPVNGIDQNEDTEMMEDGELREAADRTEGSELEDSSELEELDESFEINLFEEFNLLPSVVAAIAASGYTTPTPIQAETIPHVLAGKDIIGRAETGSGKTAAFACPLLSLVDVSNKKPQVLVLAPTRELAIQVTNSFEKYGSELSGFRAVTIYGGQSYEPQTNALRRGVQVVVGTPGRIMDHLRQGTLDLSELKTIVLDEADEMLRMGFIDDVEWILEQIPSERQTLLFSATMPGPIQKIAQNHLHKPVNISIDTNTRTAESIQQSCVLVQPRTKIEMLAQILESEETDGVIVFVKTRDTTVVIADQLSQRGFSAAPLNGEIPQNQRERTIQHLKSGRLNVLVATDVAARGLDVQRISHVINFDFPHDTEAYIHRIGRTGRAGREGTAIMFVEPKEQGKLKRLQRETNQRIDQYRQKSVAELNQVRIQRFKTSITESLANSKSLTLFTEIVNQYHRESGLPFDQIAVGLAALAQGDAPLLVKEVVSARTNWKSEPDQKGKRFQGEMATYRVEVGKSHGVGPGNIVGAITNEVALDYASIGKIKLFDEFSTIDLPANLPSSVLDELKSVVVSGQPLRITRDRRASSDRSSDRSFKRETRDRDGRRGSHSERPSRGRFDRSADSADKFERPRRSENSGSFQRPARSGKFVKSEHTERSSTTELAERTAVQSDSVSKTAGLERSSGRPGKSPKSDRTTKPLFRGEASVKSERPLASKFSSTKRSERSGKFGKPDRSSATRMKSGRAEGKTGLAASDRSSRINGGDSSFDAKGKAGKKGTRKFIKVRGSR